LIGTTEQYATIGVFAIVTLFSVAYLFCGTTAAFVTTVITTGLGYLAGKLERGIAVSSNRRAKGQNPNPFKPKNE